MQIIIHTSHYWLSDPRRYKKLLNIYFNKSSFTLYVRALRNVKHFDMGTFFSGFYVR